MVKPRQGAIQRNPFFLEAKAIDSVIFLPRFKYQYLKYYCAAC